MLFTKLLLALPFIGSSAFAHPLISPGSIAISPTIDRVADVDAQLIIAELRESVTICVANITLVSAEAEVEEAMVAVLEALDTASSAFQASGLIPTQALRRELEYRGLVDEVANDLASVVQLINDFISSVKDEVKGLTAIKNLLARLPTALGTVLINTDLLVVGVLRLVHDILSNLDFFLNRILAPVDGILGGLLVGIFG